MNLRDLLPLSRRAALGGMAATLALGRASVSFGAAGANCSAKSR